MRGRFKRQHRSSITLLPPRSLPRRRRGAAAPHQSPQTSPSREWDVYQTKGVELGTAKDGKGGSQPCLGRRADGQKGRISDQSSLLGGRSRDGRATALGAATSPTSAAATTAAGTGLALEGRAVGRAAGLEAARAAARGAAFVLLLAGLDENLAVLDLDATLAALVGWERGEDGPASRLDRLKLDEGTSLGLDNLEILDLAEARLQSLSKGLGVKRGVTIGASGSPVGEL